MYCERCKPGYMEMMGGCYSWSQGEDTPNDELCNNCEDCRRFSGSENQLDFRCLKCKQGFVKEEKSHTCNEPAKN
jgi:hypothetical protein